jgi:hypothetical protein
MYPQPLLPSEQFREAGIESQLNRVVDKFHV